MATYHRVAVYTLFSPVAAAQSLVHRDARTLRRIADYRVRPKETPAGTLSHGHLRRSPMKSIHHQDIVSNLWRLFPSPWPQLRLTCRLPTVSVPQLAVLSHKSK